MIIFRFIILFFINVSSDWSSHTRLNQQRQQQQSSCAKLLNWQRAARRELLKNMTH